MASLPEWLAVALGALLVLVTLRDVFHTVFHPAGRPRLSSRAFRLVWRVSGKLGGRARAIAGPSAMLLVIALWSAGLIVGWALIYGPWLPDDYLLAPGLPAAAQGGFLDSVYYSWVTQATLGFGDIVPRTQPFRLLGPLQATIGFALFTVAVSWVLSVYPALQRQRTAATRIRAICDSRPEGGEALPDAVAARQMARIADAVASCRVDYVQYPVTLYFTAPSDDMSLAAATSAMSEFVATNVSGEHSRVAARELVAAVDRLAGAVANELSVSSDTTDQALAAFRAHHQSS